MKVLFLLSSNASKEYITDILETLSLPQGSIQYFRYQLKWLHKKIRRLLPEDIDKEWAKSDMEKIIICYLYQKKIDKTHGQWEAVYPIRFGTLVKAYKTGKNDYDIAHFYFRVENYVSECKNIIDKINIPDIKNPGQYLEGEGIVDKILVFTNNLDLKIAKKEETKSSFHKICQSIRMEHLKSPSGNVQYFPFFTAINGIRNKKNKFLTLKCDKTSMKSFYLLSVGERYSFTFSVYFPQKPPEYLIILSSDEKIFSTPSNYELKLDSKYHEESWNLVSSLLERDVWTTLSFKAELKSTDRSKEPLNINMDFLIKVTRKRMYRIIDALSDIGFGIGTGAIALKAAFGADKMTWWYWPTVLGYATWLICKLIIKLWRG